MVGNLREVKDNTGKFSFKNVLTNVTIIPPDVFIAWAAARAAVFQPIFTDGALKEGRLSGVYAGKASFEIPVPSKMRAEASHLVEAAPPHNGGNKRKPATRTL
jgi:hypothetical protein